jgi:cell division protein FtsZ
MVKPGLINLDFADIRAVMSEMGKAMMGTGEAEGDRRAIDAAEAAISNPLLEDVSMKGARGVLINITGGPDMTLFEVDEAANRIREEVDPEANIIFGSTFEEELAGRMRISVVATGIEVDKAVQPRPLISLVSDRSKPEAGAKPSASPAAAPSPMPAAEARTAAPEARAAEPRFETKAEPVPPQAQTIEARAMGQDAFVPPRAVEATVRPAVPQPAPAPNALAAAALENGGRPPQKPAPTRTQSIFERMTKAGRLLHREEPAPPARVAPPAPAAAPAQPKLSPLEPMERPGAKEEDLLDIPAFLRRQAN